MRLLLVVFAAFSGYLILRQIVSNQDIAFAGFVIGTIIALAALKFEERVNKASINIVIGGGAGLIVGLIIANLLTYPLVLHFLNNTHLEFSAYIFTNCVIGYLGLSIGMKKGEEIKWSTLLNLLKKNNEEERSLASSLVVDTSILIDGRLADICETNFIEGTLIVPQFIIEELHYIAESQDPNKKTRGARGIEILYHLQNEKNMDVKISYDEFPDTKQVDMKLVACAKKLNSKILTNDINLNKIAKLHGVTVLNINALANALKPVILPGEVLKIHVIKTGKEQGQGVGYLDDGTMIIIDNANKHIGETIDATVTSILQTTTGRMIFSKMAEQKKPASVITVA